MPLASHIQLPERYRTTRHIASGGMASVWEVEDLLLGRVVAVKALGAHYRADPEARARFAREARTAARVCHHPHVATIYDVGEHGDEAFIVMEYFSGGTVADQLRAAADAGRRLPRDTTLRWLREAAGALDHAHAAGVVHRDVKPANLLLDGEQRLAVGDFGIARLADDTQMTQTGMLLGTAAYLSPEQALGGSATAASDRYAFAVVAFELLTGQRPYAGGPVTAQVRQHAEAQPMRASEAAPELPRAVDRVFARGLAKDPDERPPSAAGLVGELERALRPVDPTQRMQPLAPVAAPAPPRRPSPSAAPAAAPTPPGRSGRPRRVTPLVPIAVVAALAGALLAIALSAGDGDRPVAADAAKPAPAARERTQPSTAAPPAPAAQEPGQTTTGTPPAAAADDPSALNDAGHARLQAGDYAGAVQPLRASVEGYRAAGRTDEIGYAYALFNLGDALARTGDLTGAVAVFEERLQYPNQRDTVRKALRDVQRQLGGPGTKNNGKRERDDE